jgi:lipopolysaccharide biosynthesis protein
MAPVKLIAFHLTQFHPIPENDKWWGTGFTEWTNVVRGRALYPGHYQPQQPGGMGYYDLRDDAVRRAQAELARRYGIDGFCYYYYWFAGKRLLEQPVEAMLAGGAPDSPFCLCWANENWTRRWDGKDQEILIAQQHSPADDLAIIRDLIRHFRDPRYIRIDGRPLLIVYRTDLMPEPAVTIRRWRDECLRAGVGEIYLCTVRRFGMPDPAALGFDALVDFPPHGCVAAELTRAIDGLDDDFAGRIFDYRDLVRDALNRSRGVLPNFRGVFPSWDNTGRKGLRAHIFHGATPLRYRAWLAEAIHESMADPRLLQPLVFINAWNEWAEGCHLEPDAKHGHAWLEATRAARTDAASGERLWTRFGTKLPSLSTDDERRFAGASLDTVLNALQSATPYTDLHPTPLETLIAVTRRRVERWPAARRAILPVARRLGLAD